MQTLPAGIAARRSRKPAAAERFTQVRSAMTGRDNPNRLASRANESFMPHVSKRALLGFCLLSAIGAWDARFSRSEALEEKWFEKAGTGASRAGESLDVQQYCTNVAKVSAASKSSLQEAKLREIEALVKHRGEELESKRRELQAIVERHEALMRKTDETLVLVYSKMKPDAAAAQFAMLDDEVAVTILSRLNAKTSSAILSEMTASRGAGLIKKLAAFTSSAHAGKSP